MLFASTEAFVLISTPSICFDLRVAYAYGFFLLTYVVHGLGEKYPQIQQRISLEPLNRFRLFKHH